MGIRVWPWVTVALAGCNAVYGLDSTRLDTGSPRTLVFDNAASLAPLRDFPVLVVPDSSFDFGGVEDPYVNIRFHDPDTGTDLPFDVEQWNPDGESIFWVTVPQIDATADDSIEMHFGADVVNAAVGHAWEGYELVAHGLAADGTVANAAGAAYAGRATSAVPRAGLIGGAIGLPGSVTFDNSVALFDRWGEWTLEMWVYADYPEATFSGEPVFFDTGTVSFGRIVVQQDLPTPQIARVELDLELEAGDLYLYTYMLVRRWQYLVFTSDGAATIAYLNGIFGGISSFPSETRLRANTRSFQIGGGQTPFKGTVDEARVSRRYVDTDWVNAQYMSMTRRLVHFAPRE